MADEKKYPYTTVPNNLRKLLEKLPTLGTPPTATLKWLAGIGFSLDPPMIGREAGRGCAAAG